MMAACSGWLGTKWESLALSRALHGSVLLACARCYLREHGSSLVTGMCMLSWGSSGRRPLRGCTYSRSWGPVGSHYA